MLSPGYKEQIELRIILEELCQFAAKIPANAANADYRDVCHGNSLVQNMIQRGVIYYDEK
jgi:hypothetical protein